MFLILVFIREIVTGNKQISDCKFFELGSGINQGGAIYMNGAYILSIQNCAFVNCTAKVNGGAIFTSGGSLNGQRLCFFESYIKQSTNNVFGNAIYINSLSETEFISAYRCGISTTTASDSTLYFYSYKADTRNANCTSCSGNGGPQGIFLDGISSFCSIKYLSIIGGTAAHSMCFRSCTNVQIEYNVIIDATCTSAMWWLSSCNIQVSQCYMFRISYSTFIQGATLSFSNSFGDISFNTVGLTKTVFTSPIVEPILYGDCNDFYKLISTKGSFHKKCFTPFLIFLHISS